MMRLHGSRGSGIARLLLLTVCAGLAGTAAFAADQDFDTDIDSLLRKIEQQISSGHAVSPVDDSAMLTWRRLLTVEKADPNAPGVQTALSSFVVRLRLRAGEEKSAGHLVVGSDMTVFADEADRLLDAHPGGAPKPLGPIVAANQKPGTAGVPASGLRDPPRFEPLSAALAPPVPAKPAATPASASMPIPPLVPAQMKMEKAVLRPAPITGDQSAAEFYAKSGDAQLAAGDIAAASKFYDYAAKAGSIRAAVALTDLEPYIPGPENPDISGLRVTAASGLSAPEPRKPPVKPVPAYVRVLKRLRAVAPSSEQSDDQ